MDTYDIIVAEYKKLQSGYEKLTIEFKTQSNCAAEYNKLKVKNELLKMTNS